MVGSWAKGLGMAVLLAGPVNAFAEEGVIVDLDAAEEDASTPKDAPEVIEAAKPDAPETPAPVPAPAPPAESKEQEVDEAKAKDAASPAADAAAASDDDEPPRKRYAADVLSFDKWENALNIKATSMFDRKASDFSSPTVLLSAEWNYRLRTDTYVGLTLTGAPQKASIATQDGSTSNYTTYYGGIGIGQSLYSRAEFRAVVQLSGGYGVVYRRTTPANSTASSIDKPQYSFFEPGLFVTFLSYKTVDIGAVFTYRYARLIVKSPVVTNADVRSATFGLTFRNRHH